MQFVIYLQWKQKKVEIPKDFELLPERDNGHNIIRCTKMIKNERDGTTVQCGYKAIVNVAIPILTAKASEACVERYFSKQKLVLNYLRLTSKEDLVNARFLLKD